MPARIVFDEDQLYDLYINKGLTKVKIAEILKVSRCTVTDYIKSMGWQQSEEDQKKNRARPNKFKVNLDPEVLYDLYMVQNLTKEEIAEQLGVGVKVVIRCISENGIVKPKKMVIETSQRKFFEKHPLGMKDPAIREKTKETCRINFGVDYPSQNPEVQEKTRRTCMEHFGVPYSLQDKGVRDKGKETLLSMYGVDHCMHHSETIKKIQDTNMQKYGYKNPSQNQDIRQKKREAMIKKDDGKNVNLIIAVTSSRESFRNYIIENGFTTTAQIAEALGYSGSVCGIDKMLNLFDSWDLIKHYKSYFELDIKNFLKSIGEECVSTRAIIPPVEIDLYNENNRVGVEANGNYYHSSAKKPVDYHQDKSIKAEEKGVYLIHIYEEEWEDPFRRSIVESLLKRVFKKLDTVISSECLVKKIDKNSFYEFASKNSITHNKDIDICYGLFYGSDLIMACSYLKLNENNWNMNNVIISTTYDVVDGLKTIFNTFIQNQKPDSVVALCDFNKFNGADYINADMCLVEITEPDRIVNSKNELTYGAGFKKFLWKNKNFK